MKVLFAEDDAINAVLTSRYFKNLGHHVDVVADGASLLRRLQEEAFDLLLLDIELPEIHGFEAARRIRAGECGDAVKDIPIVALSGHSREEIQNDCEAAGIDRHIEKPIMIEKVQQIIEGLKQKS